MVSPTLIAAGIQGGASIIGGLLAKKPMPAHVSARKIMKGNIKGAMDMGLHPLVGAGGFSSGGFAQPTNPLGPAIANAGQDIGQAVQRDFTQKTRAATQGAQVTEMALNNASSRALQAAQTDYWKVKTLADAQAASALLHKQSHPALRVSNLPERARFYKYAHLYNDDGTYAGRVVNPDLTEGLEGMFPAGLSTTAYLTGSVTDPTGAATPRRPPPRKRRHVSGSPDYYGTP